MAQAQFRVWARGWRKYNGECAASGILAGLLVEFICACSTHEKSKKHYCESETYLVPAKTQLDADTKRLEDASALVKSLTTKNSSPPAWAQRLLEARTDMFTYANDNFAWILKYVENAWNIVKDDKAKLDAAVKAVNELVFPAHIGNTEQKLPNKTLKPKPQSLKRVCNNSGDNIKIAKRPRTRQQAKLIRKSNIPANTLTDWQQISSKIVLGKLLGRGRSGTVYSGIVNGRTVAVKVSNADASAVILNELCNEVNVYQHLVELQGDAIPRFYGHGLLEVDGTLRAALILEEINDWAGSTYPYEDRADQLSLSVRQSAMKTLDNIYACGVVHGDPRMNNLLFERTDTWNFPLKARFVDFAFAEIGVREWSLEEDREVWGKVLKLPGF
ncbi:hypothetical protein LPJ77_003150 [Coemansia sp. RSA 2523]|nr:hypothetical protein LPJ77_003150 [Coemansia sp. RSA 2523]